ncbi:MAG TPA: phenylacetate--CoA ligase [Armatimonadota bacterium]|jgi:phenylacetate-CoA ligase
MCAIWNPQAETMPREELLQLQLERLQSTLNRVYRYVAYYHRVLDEAGLQPEDLQSREDLQRLPFTTHQDLRESYPYGMFALPLREIVRLQSSLGTTGHPTVVGYTRNDLKHWTDLVARNLSGCGIGREDVVQIFFGYGLFTGGFGFHYGAEAVGAAVIPVSSGDLDRQLRIMQDFRTTALLGTPSHALYMGRRLVAQGLDPHSLSLRVGLFGAEPWSEETRREIEESLLLTAYDSYGLAEIGGPGVAAECECRCGLHLAEDHFLVEVVDPATGEPLPEGEEGELVFTTLTKEAFPLLRYRTGDVASLDSSPCACGRTLARLSRVLRRTDDLIILQGASILPEDVGQELASFAELGQGFQLRVRRGEEADDLEVLVEIGQVPDMSFPVVEHLQEQVRDHLRRALGLDLSVKLVEPRSLQGAGAPAPRVVDERTL